MPSKNPRLSVVLTPSLAATLASLSRETGDSASSLVRGLLEQTEPALLRMLELVKAANASKGQIGQGVASSLMRVVEDLHDAVAVSDARMARATADLVAQAEVVKGRRRGADGSGGAAAGGAPAVASTPVPVTRGSGTPRKGHHKGKGHTEGEGVQRPKVAAKGVMYSALNPQGERVLLPVGKAFDRRGVVVDLAKGKRRGRV